MFAASVSSRHPKTGEEGRNVQGGRSMGALRGVGFREGLWPSPTGGLRVVPPEKF